MAALTSVQTSQTFELSYAGIPFQNMEPAIEEWIKNRIPLTYLQSILNPQDRTQAHQDGFGNQMHVPRPPLCINEFYYPSAFCQWCEGYFLATETAVLAMQAKALIVGGSPVGNDLVIRADGAGDRDFTAGGVTISNMFMLPARPLFQTDTGKDGLYIVPLVDIRYFRQNQYTDFEDFECFQSWDEFYDEITEDLNIEITNDPPAAGGTGPSIEAVYGFPNPDSALWTNKSPIARMIDPCSFGLGRFLVRNLDGTFTIVRVTDNTWLTQRPVNSIAGGSFTDNVDSKGLIPTLESVLPTTIQVVYPHFIEGWGYWDATGGSQFGRGASFAIIRMTPWSRVQYGFSSPYNANLAQSNANDPLGNSLQNYGGHDQTVTLRSTARALHLTADGNPPDNDVQLIALTNQLADNLWVALAQGMDEVYLGIVKWTPEPFHDVLWTFRKDRPTTRVKKKPANYWPVEYFHYIEAPTKDADTRGGVNVDYSNLLVHIPSTTFVQNSTFGTVFAYFPGFNSNTGVIDTNATHLTGGGFTASNYTAGTNYFFPGKNYLAKLIGGDSLGVTGSPCLHMTGLAECIPELVPCAVVRGTSTGSTTATGFVQVPTSANPPTLTDGTACTLIEVNGVNIAANKTHTGATFLGVDGGTGLPMYGIRYF